MRRLGRTGRAFNMTAAVPVSPQRWSGCAAVKGDAGKDASGGNNKSCVKGGNDTPAEPGAPDLVARTSLRSCSADQCEFVIAIRNIGTADYKGDLRLGETIEGGTITSLVPFETGWSLPCEQGRPVGRTGLICHRPNTTLAPGDPLTMGVTVTFPPGIRLLGHCAIVDPPAGRRQSGQRRLVCRASPGRPEAQARGGESPEGTLRAPDQRGRRIWRLVLRIRDHRHQHEPGAL